MPLGACNSPAPLAIKLGGRVAAMGVASHAGGFALAARVASAAARTLAGVGAGAATACTVVARVARAGLVCSANAVCASANPAAMVCSRSRSGVALGVAGAATGAGVLLRLRAMLLTYLY